MTLQLLSKAIKSSQILHCLVLLYPDLLSKEVAAIRATVTQGKRDFDKARTAREAAKAERLEATAPRRAAMRAAAAARQARAPPTDDDDELEVRAAHSTRAASLPLFDNADGGISHCP